MSTKKLNGEDVRTIFVCCTYSTLTRDEAVAELEAAHRKQGFAKSAVHFVIDRDGVVLPTTRAATERGCLAGPFNDRAIQAALVGGIDSALNPVFDFTEDQIDTVQMLSDVYGDVGVTYDAAPPFENI